MRGIVVVVILALAEMACAQTTSPFSRITSGTNTTTPTSVIASSQACSSYSASITGGWKPAATAPRDGTIVEMLQTFGIAPWYGLFKWNNGMWQDASDPHRGVSENCLFWRPTTATPKTYVDPTHGKQDSIAYWCSAMHMKYNRKKDACE